jgi:hypothetical protein
MFQEALLLSSEKVRGTVGSYACQTALSPMVPASELALILRNDILQIRKVGAMVARPGVTFSDHLECMGM